MTIGIGIIGAGRMGEIHAANIQKISGTKVVAVTEVIKSKAQEFAQKYGVDSYDDYRPLLDRKDVQAVVVCNPHSLHHDSVVAAANAGKHILCEKPIETTIEKMDSMLDACKKNKVLFMPCHTHRFLPTNVKVKQLLDEGRIGKPIMAYDQILALGFQKEYPAWMGTKSLSGGGMFMVNGVHSIDRIRYWMNGDVTSVFSKSGRYALDIEVEDNGMIFLTLSNGTFANCHLSWSTPKPAGGCMIKIHGTEGIIESWVWKNSIRLVTKTDSDWVDIPVPEGNGQLLEMTEFINAIKENRPASVSPEDGRKAVSAILAAYESNECGKAIIPK
jgi:UDP-N-acetyl-2-amino-2-deoxyglucuronate dehydrogenase